MEKNKRTQWKGDVLSYDDLIVSPVNVREDLYCLTWAQSQALIAVVDVYRYVTRWESGSPVSELTEQFVNDVQRRLMMPCGSDNVIVLTQFTIEGHYQESTDDGGTWHDAPQRDPRRNVPLPPPFLPPGTEEAECTYADSIVNQAINAWINATGEGEDLATVVEGILTFIAGIFGAFGAVIAPILLAAAAAIVATSVEAWKAAFTSEVWDRFRCNLHDHQSADGGFTGAQVDAIYAQLSGDETGIVLVTLQRLVAALGPEGLTISARSGFGSPTASCVCDECADITAYWAASGGEVEYLGECTYRFTSVFSEGSHHVYIWFNNPTGTFDATKCGQVLSLDIVSGDIDAFGGYNECDTGTLIFPTPSIIGQCASQIFMPSSVAFVVDVLIAPCD